MTKADIAAAVPRTRPPGLTPLQAAREAMERTGVESVLTGLDGDLRERLEDLLTIREVDAVARRCERLLRVGGFPIPAGGWPSIPWPPF